MRFKLKQNDDSKKDIVSAVDVLKVLVVNYLHISTLTFNLNVSKSQYLLFYLNVALNTKANDLFYCFELSFI